MNIIEPIYIVFVTLAIIACAPQLLHLVRVKQSEEFELRTWGIWLGAQAVSTIYFLNLQTHLAALVSVVWMLFYVAMVTLIVYYRYRPGGKVLVAESSISADKIEDTD